MKILVIILLYLLSVSSCISETTASTNLLNTNADSTTQVSLIDTLGQTIETRFKTPIGYQRISSGENSFETFLRKLPLKKHGSFVKLYDGRNKIKENVYDAVVDLKIGNKDLHQCADAIMRLRAEYLWIQRRYSEIHFNYSNGFRAEYSKWMAGQRIIVEGHNTYYKTTSTFSNSYNDLWKYLEQVFTYCGTLSLSKELQSVNTSNLSTGDIFIYGGSPGHAVIVVDIAIDSKTNKKVFLLAQGYMPAQEIQILKNPNNADMSPWYSEDFESKLFTPEWTFDSTELKRFKE